MNNKVLKNYFQFYCNEYSYSRAKFLCRIFFFKSQSLFSLIKLVILNVLISKVRPTIGENPLRAKMYLGRNPSARTRNRSETTRIHCKNRGVSGTWLVTLLQLNIARVLFIRNKHLLNTIWRFLKYLCWITHFIVFKIKLFKIAFQLVF